MTATLTGRGVLLWLGAFFGLIFVTNAFFITVAVKTFSGEDEQKPYLQGVEYNDTLARRALQEKMGWRAAMAATRLPSGVVRIAITLVHADGSPVGKAMLAGELRHPADEFRDRALALREVAPGRYQAELPGVGAGFWDLAVNSKAANAPFEAVRRMWVP